MNEKAKAMRALLDESAQKTREARAKREAKRPKRWMCSEAVSLDLFCKAHPTPDDYDQVARDFLAANPYVSRTHGAVRARLIVHRDGRMLGNLILPRQRIDEEPAKEPVGEPAPVLAPVVPPSAGDGWRKVNTPKKWNAGLGEVIEGVYLGPRAAEGQFGPYTKHLIAPEGGSKSVLFISGTVADQLFTASMAQAGARVRVVYLGKKETANGEYNDFELYTKDPT